MQDPVGAALEACPFLARLASEQGEAFARSFATNPLVPAGRRAAAAPATGARRPLFEEGASSVSQVAALFHGPGGLVPLTRFGAGDRAAGALNNPEQQPEPATTASLGQRLGLVRGPAGAAPAAPAGAALAASGAASISLGGVRIPGPGDAFRPGTPGKGQARARQVRARQGGNSPSSSASSSSSPSSSSGAQPSALEPSGNAAPVPAATGGKCPLRALLPAVGGLIAFPSKMKCPAPICAIRGAIAKTKAVKVLRPQGLPVKFAAVSAFTAAVNVPCGAWRENFEKFSPGWFVAVHLTIPVVGMFRKALLMPPYALVMTIAAAIAGQQIGASLERHRRSRYSRFTAYTPELAASYGSCPILPNLHETPQNSAFALEVQHERLGWELADRISRPAALAAAGRRAVAVTESQWRASPLSLAVPV